MTWEPEQYLRGNYFQNEINREFIQEYNIQPYGAVLDIGSGDGQLTRLLANNMKQGHILGIDSSADMVKHANRHWSHKNLSFEVQNIDEYQYTPSLDFALSFWCLHWTNIELSLPNIYESLKIGGKLYAVFSSFSENSISQAWLELAKQEQYKNVTQQFIDATIQHQNYFYRVFNVLNELSFTQVKLNLKTMLVPLPDLSYFKNLLITMPFMNTISLEIKEELMEALLKAFQNSCQRRYAGKLYYETRPIFLEAVR